MRAAHSFTGGVHGKAHDGGQAWGCIPRGRPCMVWGMPGGMCGRGCAWGTCVVGGCVAGEHACPGEHVLWEACMPGEGACMAGGVHGRGHVWQGVCMAGGMCGRGKCMACSTPSPVDRMTDACKNITLPQTSFAGGNKWLYFRKYPPPILVKMYR